ncbi:siderophore-interacting protein [Marivirga lumbricoides]|uniref:Siderophore-interacting protein n=1 Tax=Marivirga lumbricoides TaxID=1046115 RepID=A0A2T4DSW9_9BACT|nr:siderophore-interacting protein [Marivirga lumbricoides]
MISSIPKWVGDLFESTLRPNVKVLETSYLSSQIKKIRFQGDISKMNFKIGYANVLRVSETEYRNYTAAYYNKAKAIIDIIFHIHTNGVGSEYFDSLKADDETFIGPSRGKKLYNPSIENQFFFGDETSLGLACALLPLMKNNHHQFQFFFELDEENKNVPKLLGLENFTVFPKDGTFRNEKKVNELPICKTTDWLSANYILTGNVKSVQTFRKVLKHKVTGRIFHQGYWLEGKKGL